MSTDMVISQPLVDLLLKVLGKINDQTDLVYTRFEMANELRDHISTQVEKLKAGDLSPVNSIYLDFAPTGLYQELSIQNNWAEEYLDISKEFDKIYDKLINKNIL